MQLHKTKQNKTKQNKTPRRKLRCYNSGWKRGRKIGLSVFERHYALKLFYL
jgi:hypothetical protein